MEKIEPLCCYKLTPESELFVPHDEFLGDVQPFPASLKQNRLFSWTDLRWFAHTWFTHTCHQVTLDWTKLDYFFFCPKWAFHFFSSSPRLMLV